MLLNKANISTYYITSTLPRTSHKIPRKSDCPEVTEGL